MAELDEVEHAYVLVALGVGVAAMKVGEVLGEVREDFAV